MTSDSNNDGMVNRVIDDSPIVFGVRPNDIKLFGNGFMYEIYQCSRDPRNDDGNNLNIMHISTDLTAISNVITEIIDFLKLRNFSVECMDVSKEWPEIDILIIGGDKQHTDNAVKLSHIFSSMCGMFDRLDILLYKLDGKTAIGWSPMEKLWLPGDLFKFECMFTICYNIRKWIDPVVNRGIIADRVVDIEGYLDLIVEWNEEPRSVNLFNMLNRFKTNVNDNGHNDLNSEIFFAAMNAIRLVRNISLHGSRKESDNSDDTFSIDKFNKIAIKHGRSDLCAHLISDEFRSKMDAMKDCVRLATYSLEWIKEYSKRYGQK